MVVIAKIGNISVRRVTEFTPWFDVYKNEEHHKGYANAGDAFVEMMELVANDQI